MLMSQPEYKACVEGLPDGFTSIAERLDYQKYIFDSLVDPNLPSGEVAYGLKSFLCFVLFHLFQLQTNRVGSRIRRVWAPSLD